DLSEAERKKAHELLTHHPHYESYLTKHRLGSVAVEEWVFLRAATWPHHLRGPVRPGEPDPAGVRSPRTGRHSAAFPVFPPPATRDFTTKVRERPEKHDVVCALKQRVAELRLRTAADDDRAVALCWLLHLTGDVHQPLHCASLFTDKFPEGDFGGNAIGFRFG